MGGQQGQGPPMMGSQGPPQFAQGQGPPFAQGQGMGGQQGMNQRPPMMNGQIMSPGMQQGMPQQQMSTGMQGAMMPPPMGVPPNVTTTTAKSTG